MPPRSGWLALLLLAPFPSLAAEAVPLWEAGIGVGVADVPDYRGSDERRTFVLPVPYFVYRGDRLRVDREGIRGELLGTDRASFNLSATLGPPANSDENAARAGMPDLDPTVEIGPALNIRLHRNAAHDRQLSLRLPLRAVVATDLTYADYIGAAFLPHIALEFTNLGRAGGWHLGLTAGPIFATDAYHDYYYAVPAEFATSTRRRYDARGGYSGVSAGLTISKRYPKYWVGAFMRYDNLRGAVFDDSPLVRTPHAFMAGFAISRIIAQSSARVPASRDIGVRP